MQQRKIKLTPALRSYLNNKGVLLPGRKEKSVIGETKILKKLTPVVTMSRRVKINHGRILPEVKPLNSNELKKQRLIILVVAIILLIVIFLIAQFTY